MKRYCLICLIFCWAAFSGSLVAEKETEVHDFALSGYVASTHPGAYHQLKKVTLPGGMVVLEDGSEWVGAPYYWEAMEQWAEDDPLLLTPYKPWFFHYFEFKLVNQRTGDEVLVNWCKPPDRSSAFTRTIAQRHSYEIVLDDGTRWRIKGGDRPTIKFWKKNDIVIIATNGGSFSWSNPNVLINMRNSSWVRCACMP